MTARKLLTRDAILNAEDRQTEIVEVPEWGGSVKVRSLEGFERDRYEASLTRMGRDAKGRLEVEGLNSDNVRARLCAMTIVDDAGANLFSENDVLILGHKSAAALDRVFSVASRLSHLTDQDVESLMESLGKDQSAASGTDSPETSA
jgi:hypothetical protein